MKLVENDSIFELRIVEYESPDSNEIDDANWLIIEIDITDEKGFSWSARESCLRTFELVKLRDWFQCIRNGGASSSSISFTENELAFSYKSNGVLDVISDFGFHPKGCDYDYDTDSEYAVQFTLKETQLNSLIDSLNSYIEQFPEKS